MCAQKDLYIFYPEGDLWDGIYFPSSSSFYYYYRGGGGSMQTDWRLRLRPPIPRALPKIHQSRSSPCWPSSMLMHYLKKKKLAPCSSSCNRINLRERERYATSRCREVACAISSPHNLSWDEMDRGDKDERLFFIYLYFSLYSLPPKCSTVEGDKLSCIFLSLPDIVCHKYTRRRTPPLLCRRLNGERAPRVPRSNRRDDLIWDGPLKCTFNKLCWIPPFLMLIYYCEAHLVLFTQWIITAKREMILGSSSAIPRTAIINREQRELDSINTCQATHIIPVLYWTRQSSHPQDDSFRKGFIRKQSEG